MNARHHVQRWIRGAHLFLLRRPMPHQLGLSFHALEEPHWNEFAAMVTFFQDRNYDFVGPIELCQENTNRCVFCSFDDNFQSWYRALPLFDKLDVKATFYTNTLPMRDRADRASISDYYDRISHFSDRTPLSSEELSAIADRGHTIGCHTHTHPHLESLPEDEARDEIRRSKEELEEIVRHPVVHFAYPYGFRRNFRPSLRAYCREIGFETVGNAIPAVQCRGHQPYSINRSHWDFDESIVHNVENLCIDGRLFEFLTGRSAVG